MKLNQERQITVLISSHILDELSRLATWYGFIDQGKLVKELSAEELEASCRKCARVEVSNIDALSRVLDERHIDYEILSETSADIYAKLSITQLVLALYEQNCELLSIQERDESLESYFINLVGGGKS